MSNQSRNKSERPNNTKREALVYLDIETQRTADDVGGWFPEKMGLAVAVVLSGHQVQIFTEKDIGKLAEVLHSANCVVGYNIKDFDFKVLEGYEWVNLKAVKCLDLMRSLETITGSRIMFSSIEKATMGITQDFDGLEGVKLWKEGNLPGVMEFISNRVLAIKAVHEYGRTNGEVFHYPKNSSRRKRIEVEWSNR